MPEPRKNAFYQLAMFRNYMSCYYDTAENKISG